MPCCGTKKDFEELQKVDMLLTWAIEHGDKEEEERLRKQLDRLQEKAG